MTSITIKLYKNRVVIEDARTGRTTDRRASAPFSSNRLLVADVDIARQLIKDALIDSSPSWTRWTTLWPRAEIRAMELTDGGLSPVETNTLLELGKVLGFASVKVSLEHRA